jgi:antitoxin (DNA-binding transcriptional repressor) of toxin-antitoxin stability system
MVTVTAKQLRENLSGYLDRAEAGEEVAVIRHSKIVTRMMPPGEAGAEKYSGEANAQKLRALLPELHTHRRFSDPDKTYKQLRDELYGQDPKYRRYRGL